MNKRLITLFFLTTYFLSGYSDTILAKYQPTDDRCYCIFSGGTYWKVNPFVKRWRTPLEWLFGHEYSLPHQYVCTIDQFDVSDEYEIYLKHDYSRVDETEASNEEEIKKSSHVLVSRNSGKVFFSYPLYPSDFISMIYHDGISKGKSEGYSQGHTEGQKNGYSSGYNDGYTEGYSSGFSSAKKDVEKDKKNDT